MTYIVGFFGYLVEWLGDEVGDGCWMVKEVVLFGFTLLDYSP